MADKKQLLYEGNWPDRQTWAYNQILCVETTYTCNRCGRRATRSRFLKGWFYCWNCDSWTKDVTTTRIPASNYLFDISG